MTSYTITVTTADMIPEIQYFFDLWVDVYIYQLSYRKGAAAAAYAAVKEITTTTVFEWTITFNDYSGLQTEFNIDGHSESGDWLISYTVVVREFG